MNREEFNIFKVQAQSKASAANIHSINGNLGTMIAIIRLFEKGICPEGKEDQYKKKLTELKNDIGKTLQTQTKGH